MLTLDPAIKILPKSKFYKILSSSKTGSEKSYHSRKLYVLFLTNRQICLSINKETPLAELSRQQTDIMWCNAWNTAYNPTLTPISPVNIQTKQQRIRLWIVKARLYHAA